MLSSRNEDIMLNGRGALPWWQLAGHTAAEDAACRWYLEHSATPASALPVGCIDTFHCHPAPDKASFVTRDS
jgi:hypothetical protein